MLPAPPAGTSELCTVNVSASGSSTDASGAVMFICRLSRSVPAGGATACVTTDSWIVTLPALGDLIAVATGLVVVGGVSVPAVSPGCTAPMTVSPGCTAPMTVSPGCTAPMSVFGLMFSQPVVKSVATSASATSSAGPQSSV